MKDNTALELYLLLTLLLERLDNIKHHNIYKNKFKKYTKDLIKEIENFDKKVFQNEEASIMMQYLNDKTTEIEKVLQQ